jgi:hypothetical protein
VLQAKSQNAAVAMHAAPGTFPDQQLLPALSTETKPDLRANPKKRMLDSEPEEVKPSADVIDALPEKKR